MLVSLRSLTLLCLSMSSEGRDPLVALQCSLDLIRSNMGEVLWKKFKLRIGTKTWKYFIEDFV